MGASCWQTSRSIRYSCGANAGYAYPIGPQRTAGIRAEPALNPGGRQPVLGPHAKRERVAEKPEYRLHCLRERNPCSRNCECIPILVLKTCAYPAHVLSNEGRFKRRY